MGITSAHAQELGHGLIRMVKLFGSLRQHAPRMHPGIENSSYAILFQLNDGPRRISAIAECVHSDTSTVSRQVSTLVNHGFLEKAADPDDGRAYAVSLTAQGKQALSDLQEQRGQWLSSLLSDFSPSEVDQFQGYVERFTTALENQREELIRAANQADQTGPLLTAGAAAGSSAVRA